MEKKLSFWKTFVYAFLIILILLTIFFGFVGSYEASGFRDAFIGIAILSVILALLATFFIKWWKEYKSKGKFVLEEKNKKQTESFLNWDLFKWKMDEEELKNQIENYNTLGFFGSARKVATALMIFSAIITLIFAMVSWLPSETRIDVVLILILTFFVYKGKKWAMIVTMIYWTFSKGFQLVSSFSVENFSGGNIIMPIIWWAIFMGVFWQAYQVENERKKQQNKISRERPQFCKNCGNQLEKDSKYCVRCGAKTILVD